MFPLTFLSNAFVPLGGLPAGLRTVAEWNPISASSRPRATLFGNPTALPADAAVAAAASRWSRRSCGASRCSPSPCRWRSARYRARTAG